MLPGIGSGSSGRHRRAALGQLVRFAITGIGNTAIGFAVLLVALEAGFGDVAANLIGFGAGLAFGFAVNRRWTFALEGRISVAEVARYLAGFALAWCLNITVVLAGVNNGMVHSPFVHLAGIAVYSISFYLLCRWFVFTPPS